MISYWECKLKVNGQPKSIEIVGENPTFEKYENRIKRNFSPKDKIEFIAFVLKVEKLGLIRNTKKYMSKKAYIETLTSQEIKRGKYGKTPHQALLISIPKITLMEYKNLCKIEDISQSKILVGLIKDFIEIKKLSESKLKQARERLK